MREALAYLIQKNPRYILISADHPNKKVRLLPRMLIQAFPVRVIGFAEKNAGISTKNLHEMNLEYNLYPPVSGPAIQRMILKIKKDEDTQEQETLSNKSSRPTGDASSANDLITFKGQTPTEDVTKTSFEQARAALSQLVNSADATGGDESSPDFASGSQSPSPSSMINFQQRGDSLSSSPEGPAYHGGPGAESSQKNPTPSPTSQDGAASGFQSGTSNWNSASHSFSSPSPSSDSTSSEQRGHDGVPIMESNYVPRSAAKPYRMQQEKEPLDTTGPQSLFVRGAQKALSESTNLKNADGANEIAQTSNLACILVESARFSGYLVCAMGQNRKIDQDFTNIIRQRLLRFLKDNGEEIREQDPLSLKIQTVDFTAWTLEQAEFLKKSVHDGDEIAIAFFPATITSPELQRSVSEKMVMLHINELKGDAIVEFDLYIFMPENNKYLLYTPQGRPLYGKQRDRLKDKGITHMHLRKETAHEMSKYRAQNFLNEKIDAYRAKFKAANKIK